MRIKEDFKKAGYFWIPSVPEERVHGTLSISDGGNIELEVTTGQLKDRNGKFNINLERIVGYFHGSIPSILVTLDDCYYKILPTIGGTSKSLIRINRAFIRVQYDQDEIPSFNTLTFSVEGINEWVGISGIKVEEQPEKWISTISYESPENVSLDFDNGMQLSITWGHHLKYSNKEAGISEKICFKLISQKSRELGEFTSVAHKITELLCFVMDQTVCLDSMHATSDDLTREDGNSNTVPVQIDIYYRSWPYSKDAPKIVWYNMLFKLTEIQNDIEGIINNWIKGYKQITPAFNLYFLAKMGSQTYLEERFLTLAQGLEAYHRRTSDEKQMDEAEFEELVENLIKHCSGERREWLRSKLKYGNEVSFRKRIKQLIEPFKDLFGNKKKRKKLTNRIVDTRNYLTHYDLSLESKAAQGEVLWSICLKMELLFQLHFLQLMGFRREQIDSVVANCAQLKRKCNL